MSERKHFKVHLCPGGAHGSWVEIDGERQTNVRGITVTSRVGEATTVNLELINVEAVVDGYVDTTHLGSTKREYAKSIAVTAAEASAARDLDETRRLCYIAKVALKAGRKVSSELAGTLVHAIVHHSELLDREDAERLGDLLLDPAGATFDCLDALTDIIAACESS